MNQCFPLWHFKTIHQYFLFRENTCQSQSCTPRSVLSYIYKLGRKKILRPMTQHKFNTNM